MQFSRIRLSGFKSFVDPTELHIEPGLTGVVGPNGCGKSNLLEAIRWVMGENSAKSMRGAGMDDVIFAGTDRRPARNLAEVTLMLDNDKRTAPAEFNDSKDLEVSRRIERDSGSAYRINGRDVRAKDVQLLFADAATGAHSPALVSQGRVGALISAKPQNRRAILEEAAGITGLHKRRKEAESRLKGAETNLLRLHDVMQQMDTQADSLKRQARQATRYRNISGDLRRAEAILLYQRWKAACEAVLEAERQLRQAENRVAEITGIVAGITTEHSKLAHRLPDLRQEEAEAAAAYHRLKVERDNLEREKEHILEQREELKARIDQTEGDKARERELMDDASDAMKRLSAESAEIETELAQDEDGEAAAAKALEEAHTQANEGEVKLDALSTAVASTRARHESLKSDLENLERRRARLQDEENRAREELAELESGDEQLKEVEAATAALTEAETLLNKLRELVGEREQERLSVMETRDEARGELNGFKAEFSGLEAEIKALEGLIASTQSAGESPVADSLKVKKGYETALGAALGDDLEAPASDTSAIGWRNMGALPDAPTLPDGATALSEFVSGADALARRLSQIGVVDQASGAQLAAKLLPGQRLVTTDGALWRWDGFVRSADVQSAAAIRLSQKNRLEELAVQRASLVAKIGKAEQNLMNAERAIDVAHAKEREARAERGDAEKALEGARRALSTAERAGNERAQRLATLKERTTRIAEDQDETAKRLKKLAADREELGDGDAREKELMDLRAHVEGLRAKLSEARAEYDSRHRIQAERKARVDRIKDELANWTARSERAVAQIAAFEERAGQAAAQLKELDAAPDAIDEKRNGLLSKLTELEAARQAAADKLAEAEQAANDRERGLKDQQTLLGQAREERVRFEAAHENTAGRRDDLAHRITEKFECAPAKVLDVAEVKNQDDMPAPDDMERKLERLKAERERLGAVNLRADVELQELTEQLEHLEKERDDLEAAIARLRHGIGSLNREGRERMLAAFEKVNQYFGELFESLFGGGHAYLELVDSDDPLEAGLEIMASPPGKKLQSLSLLSGGEQAMTATSLIFAVFMTNPAPICVLDEVDAPLDDANVERFCGLLDNIISKTSTRFLIVTHNAVTMSRMDRLFGVTMSERGVSQLVSVDLDMAEQLQAAG